MIEIYTKPSCPYCRMAKSVLDQMGLAYNEVVIEGRPELRQDMITRSGRRTVPQIFVHGEHLGGYTDLAQEIKSGTFEDRMSLAS